MRIDIKPRGGGKTTKAVEWIKAGRLENRKDSSDRILVVLSEKEKRRVMEVFGLGYHEVESWDTILMRYHRPTLARKELYLDNADIFLQQLFGGLLRGISLTCDQDFEGSMKEK